MEAWVRISEARTLLHGWPDQGTVLRQAVDVGMTCGQWERAWSNAQEQIADTTQRNELIAVLSKAAVLAWHANRREEVRGLGERAQSLSVAVDHPWVRTYAYLGHVAAAAVGAGSLEAALQAYARCTSRAGHATRPHRAWQAAQIALESGHSPDDVEEFLAATLPDGLGDLEQHVRVLIADARRHDVEPAAALDLLQPSRSGPDRARVHLALARTPNDGGVNPRVPQRHAARRRSGWPRETGMGGQSVTTSVTSNVKVSRGRSGYSVWNRLTEVPGSRSRTTPAVW